jgi:hypothetical protein
MFDIHISGSQNHFVNLGSRQLQFVLSSIFFVALTFNIVVIEYIVPLSSYSLHLPILFCILYFLFGCTVTLFPLLLAIFLSIFYFLIQINLQQGINGYSVIITALVFSEAISKGFIRSRHIIYFLVGFISVLIIKAIHEVYAGTPLTHISNMVPLSGSRNLISIHAIFITSLFYFLQAKEGNKVSIAPSVMCLVVCILSTGRSGTVSAILLFSIVLFKFQKDHIRFNLKFVFLFIAFSSLLAVNLDDVPIFNLFESPLDDPRYSYLSSFVSAYSPLNLITGVNIKDASYLSDVDGNPHNSFVSFISMFGLGALIFIFFIFSSFLANLIRGRYFQAFIVVPFLVRMTTDTGLFLSIYDCLLFAYITSALTPERVTYSNFRRSRIC